MPDTQAQEFARLANLEPETPPPDPKAEPTAEEKAAAEAAQEQAEAKAKADAEAEEEKAKKWSVPLQKLQQQRATDAKRNDEKNAELSAELKATKALLKKLAEANGIEEDAPAAPKVEPEAEESEIRGDLAATKRELEFVKIRQANPDADPDKLWDDAIAEVLDLHGIDPNDEALPEGITQRALSIAANKVFRKKVDSLKPAAKKAEPEPPKAPPKTPGGAAVTSKPASPIPSPAKQAEFDRTSEYRKLAGLE